MEKAEIPVVKRSLFSWVFAGNAKLQISLLLIIVVMVFARVVPLEMQKRIVNEAINLRDSESDVFALPKTGNMVKTRNKNRIRIFNEIALNKLLLL